MIYRYDSQLNNLYFKSNNTVKYHFSDLTVLLHRVTNTHIRHGNSYPDFFATNRANPAKNEAHEVKSESNKVC